MQTHQSLNSLVIAAVAQGHQMAMHPYTTVGAVALLVDHLNFTQ
jgi:hypothetical protein